MPLAERSPFSSPQSLHLATQLLKELRMSR